MGCNMKKGGFSAPGKAAAYRRSVMRLHRDLLLVHAIGVICVGLVGTFLLAYYPAT